MYIITRTRDSELLAMHTNYVPPVLIRHTLKQRNIVTGIHNPPKPRSFDRFILIKDEFTELNQINS